jgi:hypothetical protein
MEMEAKFFDIGNFHFYHDILLQFTLKLHKLLTIRTWASRSERLRGEPLAESALSSPSLAEIHSE